MKVTEDTWNRTPAKKSETREEFDLEKVYFKFSLGSIASRAFGIDARGFTDKKSDFVEHTANILSQSSLENVLQFVGLVPG